ncbi:MAG: anaerobic ribonucleoside-triphosphate reductase activating protein [Flammeovirgaceae bacterium]|nr:anaerobic ribonucleoside-triphosphate reductase activating protein [Flammeovirgaceae bacterium]
MKIQGLQKTTLIDYPGKIACTLFLAGCNFRCSYCHNPELIVVPKEANYSESEVLEFLEKRKGQLEGVCITGGEPLFSLDIEFVRKIKALGYFIKLDTNGSFPNRLQELIDENLVDYIAMDIKASREMYERVVNSKILIENIERSIRIVSGFPNYEFRTTIVKKFHNTSEIARMFEWVRGLIEGRVERYYLQGFKNNGKLIDNSLSSERDVEENYLLELKEVCEGYCGEVGVRV